MVPGFVVHHCGHDHGATPRQPGVSRELGLVMWHAGVALAVSALLMGLAGIVLAAPDCTATQCVYLPLMQQAVPPTPTATNTPSPTVPPPTATPTPTIRPNCDPAYPTVCIPSPPPDLDCGDITYRRFTVLPPDPHNFDSDFDGIGCEGP